MKKSFIALALLVSVGSSFACSSGTSCTTPGSSSVTSNGSGYNTVISQSITSATVGAGGGSSYSQATNTQASTAAISAVGTVNNKVANCDVTLGGTAAIVGAVTTSGSSMAFNVSTGSGTGGAYAGGTSTAAVQGSASYNADNALKTVGAAGNVSAAADATTTTWANALTNQGSFTSGAANAGFDLSASSGVTTTGDCTGTKCTVTSDTKTASTSNTSYASTTGNSVVANVVTVDGKQLALGTGGVFTNASVTNAVANSSAYAKLSTK